MLSCVRICDLRQKDVINCRDGKCIGHIWDIEMDICQGRICNIIVPGPACICGIFGGEFEYVIPFSCIKRIGVDVVIVDIDTRDCRRRCD